MSELLHGQPKIASHAQFACLSSVVNAVKHGNWMWHVARATCTDKHWHRHTQAQTRRATPFLTTALFIGLVWHSHAWYTHGSVM